MPYPKLKEESYRALGGINVKASSYALDKTEFLDIVNFDFSRPGALTKRYGSTQYIGNTVAGTVGGLIEFERLSGASYLVFSANTNIYNATSGTPISFRSGLLNNAIFDFVTFVDRLFCFNGQNAFKYDGSQASNYTLPPGSGFTFALGASHANGLSGLFTYYYGYLNDRGYYGPAINGVTVSATSQSFITFSGFTVPTGYGISAIVFYRTPNDQSTAFRISEIPATQATFVDTNFSLTNNLAPPYIWFTLAPKFGELYNNQMFVSGFSSMLSTVYFSDIGEPEGIGSTAFFEVRTNDGDKVTGQKSYYSQLMIFKEKSFHSLAGDSPQNFTLREISDQYGALNNRSIVVYEDKLLFLDRKGIVQFNGANVDIISNRVEDYFLNMNLAAARNEATMIHVRERNEVWTMIPYNGATLNNIAIVYDYVADAFTTYKGFFPRSVMTGRGSFTNTKVFFGDYAGTIHQFDDELRGDNGAGMTALVQTSNVGGRDGELGYSVEKFFRRLFLDTDVASGSTVPVNIEFRVSDGTSLALTREMGQTLFQSRIDFGLSSKSVNMTFTHFSDNETLRINGYTIEYRFQRAV